MPTTDYMSALKNGQKECRACIAQGIYPYLPALEQFVAPENLSHGIDLGIVQIPVEYIVGTKNSGRTNAFARNFMPILDAKSEFAAKWIRLSEAHLEEGIREPIKAYEYMNRYYVEEGNKRVSVLKHYGAITIPGHVVRILPPEDGDEDTSLYYEFVRFHKLSGINFIEFSKPGSFEQLSRLLGKEDEVWTQEERQQFTALYYRFRRAFESAEGNSEGLTVSDSFLTCVRIYSYLKLYEMTDSELAASLSKAWEDVSLQKEEQPIEVRLDPEEEKKQGLLSRVLGGSSKTIKAVFIHDRSPETSGWTYGHELGRNHAQEILGSWLDSSSVFNAMDEDPAGIIEREIKNGNQVIFTTSPRLLPASLTAAVEHSDVLIFNCSLNVSHRYVRTYYARMYEAKFIIGAVAGALAGSDSVGYICDYPIYGQIAGINAFALGVQMVNPTCKVVLEWSSVGETGEAMQQLQEKGIRLVSSQDMAAQYGPLRTSFGLSLVIGKDQVHLASPVWHWGNYYEGLLRRIRSRSIQADYEETDRALNYYWGMSADVVQVICSEKVPDSTRKLAELLQDAIRNGSCNPFRVPLYTQTGDMIDSENHFLSIEDIISMDWLAENVVGRIPAYEELNEVGRSTVEQMGINTIWKARN